MMMMMILEEKKPSKELMGIEFELVVVFLIFFTQTK